MVVHFLAHTETLDHVIKTKCKVLSFLGIANSGKGMTMRGIIGCTCPRKYAPERRWFLFSHKYITLLGIKTVISKENNELWGRVITHWAT